MKPKIVAIVQARMGSSRLPGKVMLDIEGKPLISRILHRISFAKTVDATVIATTDIRGDDILAAYSLEQRWTCFRGSENDVLDRYYQAACACDAKYILRITADCPLMDPTMIDWVVTAFQENQPLDYLTNEVPVTFPRGLDVEIMTFDALQKAWEECENLRDREHVTPYIYNHQNLFRIKFLSCEMPSMSRYRLTVDVAEDLDLIRRVYHHFGEGLFSWQDAVRYINDNPELYMINSHVIQKNP